MDEIKVTGTTIDATREMLSDDVAAREFLKASFLSSAMTALFYARRKAELTQAQVAERMGTKQSAIARMEADASGSTSLRRYVEYALTCDMIPFDITLARVSTLKEFARADPSVPRTEVAYQAWRGDKGESAQSSADEAYLVPRLSDDLLAEALEQAQAIEDERVRALIVKMAAPSLDAHASDLANLVNKVLEIVRSIKDEELRHEADLALQRPALKNVLDKAIAARAIIEREARAIIEEELGSANGLQQDPAPKIMGLRAFIEAHSGPEPVPTPEEMREIVREGILAEARAEYGDLPED